MSNIAYETLGRVTWAVGKRKARSYFIPSTKKGRAKRVSLVLGVVVVGVVVAGAALERASAP